MTTITRERIAQYANDPRMCNVNDEIRQIARIALASLEAVPYGYMHKAAYEEVGSCGLSNDHEAYRDSSTHIAVYTAPPAPVVPEDISNAIETLKKTLVSCHRYNYCSDAVKRLEEACRAAMLQGTEPVQGWIPCSERMPEEIGRYWCYVEEQNSLGKSHYQWNCSWNGDRWWVESENGGRVTHWMPLPAAPQQEVKNV